MFAGISKSSDLSSTYGYGSVAWKERVDGWKSRQEKLQMTTTEGVAASTVSKGGSIDENGMDGADLPMYITSDLRSCLFFFWLQKIWRGNCFRKQNVSSSQTHCYEYFS